MIIFDKYCSNWTLNDDERFNIEYIRSMGNTLDELHENAEISIVDWNGNEGPYLTSGDLSSRDFAKINDLFFEALLQAEESKAGVQ